jgi:RNA polymerase sigma-70 factor (ECF subfamily)
MASVVQTFEDLMSERGMPSQLDAALQSAQELQNRFISDNLRRIFRLIYRIVGNVADAQDLTQEAFIKALQRQDQLKDLDKAAHWLSRIASNTAIDFLRRSGKVNFCEIDTVLLLRDVEGLPAEDVASQMNCSKATVRSHIANARIKFRRYIERSRRAQGRKPL